MVDDIVADIGQENTDILIAIPISAGVEDTPGLDAYGLLTICQRDSASESVV